MPLRSSLHATFPLRASEALALCAWHPIAEISYRASFSVRCKWSQSFHPTTRDRLVGVFPQVALFIHQRGTLHSQGTLAPHFAWSSFANSLVVGYKEGLMKTPKFTTLHSPP